MASEHESYESVDRIPKTTLQLYDFSKLQAMRTRNAKLNALELLTFVALQTWQVVDKNCQAQVKRARVVEANNNPPCDWLS